MLTAEKCISLPLNSSQSCHWQKLSQYFQDTQIHSSSCSLLSSWNLSGTFREMLLVDLQHEIDLSCCCSHRGHLVGMTPFLLAPTDTQGWSMSFAQGGEEDKAMENECKLWGLWRTGSVRNVSTPHTSTGDLSPPSPSFARGLLSTKPSLHTPQHPGSGKRDHHLLPHSLLSPVLAALPVQGCTQH